MTSLSKSKKVMISIIVSLIAISVSGCGGQLNQMNTPNNDYGRTQALNDQHHVDKRVQLSEAAADSIIDIEGVQQANVLITEHNAYVAALINEESLSRKLEDSIAERVRSVNPAVENVYVSTNPEFIDRIQDYVVDLEAGRPVSGFVDQFNEMIQRVFPNAR